MSTDTLAVQLVARAGWTLLAHTTLSGDEPTHQYLNYAHNPYAFTVKAEDLMALLREVDVFRFENKRADHRIIYAMVTCAEVLAQEGSPVAKDWVTHELSTHSEEFNHWLTEAEEDSIS